MQLLTAAAFRALLLTRVGRAYVLGQPIPYNTKDPRALDCSGLVCWALYWSGQGIGDTTAAGLWNRSTQVTGDPRVGDLVFLANHSGRKAPPGYSRGIGHVAIITAKLSNGDFEIVEARGRAAGVVKTTLSYWKRRTYYAGVRRLTGFKLAPTPTVATTTATKLRIGLATQQNQRFAKDALPSTSSKRGQAMAELLAASIYVCTETDKAMRAAILAELGAAWMVRVHSAGSLAVFWHTGKWSARAGRSADFGDHYHGAIAVPLVNRATGQGLDVIATHTRPKSVATPAQKITDVRKAFSLRGTWPAAWVGDWAMDADEHAAAAGLVRVSPDADTMDAAGDHHVDAIYVTKGGRVALRKSSLVDPGQVSDHRWVLGQLTVTAPTPTA